MVQGVCQKRAAVYFFCYAAGVPVHAFLAYNGKGCNGKRYAVRRGQFALGGKVQYFLYSGKADARTCQCQKRRHDDGGNTFHAFVPVLMFHIGGFVRYFYAGHNNKVAENIRRRVDCIRNKGGRMAQNACGKFGGCQKHVKGNAFFYRAEGKGLI